MVIKKTASHAVEPQHLGLCADSDRTVADGASAAALLRGINSDESEK